jgi:glycosyltransferase involved in cell wall biosynthesis
MDLIHQLGLANFIHTPGRVNNDLLPQYLRLANLYVSAALSDGTSVSLLEAMACALPVIVTKGYGNLEWVTPQQNGWLAEPGSPEILAKTLDEALSNPARLGVLGSANRSAVLDRADWKRNFPKLLTLLEKLSLLPIQTSPSYRRRLSPTEVQ